LRALREEYPQGPLRDLSSLRGVLQVLGVRGLRKSAVAEHAKVRPLRRMPGYWLLWLLAMWRLFVVAEPRRCALPAL